MRRLAALGNVDGASLRLSKKDQRRLALYQSLISGSEGPLELGYRHGFTQARDALLLRAALLEMPLDPDALVLADRGARATFPVKPRDLMPDYTGPALGEKLRNLEDAWIASGLSLGKSDLLS